MILLASILANAINPALALLPSKMDSDAARVLLLTIGLQETRFKWRYQLVKGRPGIKGPAKSFWQFEEPTVGLVLRNAATARHANMLCSHFGLRSSQRDVHWAMEENDVLAASFARLLLWADAKPLPPVNASHDEAWDAYMRIWGPGKPHRTQPDPEECWDHFHTVARAQVLT